MKLKFFLAALTAAAMLISSCGDDDEKDDPIGVVPDDLDFMIIDWYPIEVEFFVENLDESVNYVNGNFNDIIHTTTLTYKGETYSVEDKKLSKDYMPIFEGLVIDSIDTQKKFFRFGELSGSANYDDDFVINFADGTSDVIHFKRVHKGGLNVDDSWTLNGEAHSGRFFYLKHEFADDKSN
jgi:hypothetical protein